MVFADPVVTHNTISWPDDGWYQVQRSDNFKSLCQGGRRCTVPAGVYIVINHSTGERFKNIAVVDQIVDEISDSAPAPVAATGQIVSQEFGDDGDYQSGVTVAGVRFQDNGDGTFTDALTGIVWLSIIDCVAKRNWSGALDYANALSAGGDLCPALDDDSLAGDWRLPNIKELLSLADVSNFSQAWADDIPYIGTTWANDPSDFYWSSSTFSPTPTMNAWAFEAGFGDTTIRGKNNVECVWPIRVGN